MKTSSLKILLNAEAFGFGPAAAIAQIAHQLRPKVQSLGYIGAAHTLDLQSTLLFDAVYDTSGKSVVETNQLLNHLADQYDIFVTAMDFSMASQAKAAGMPVIIYDALAWYWPEIPDSIHQADLYLPQNFMGVVDRLLSAQSQLPHTVIVPPITRHIQPTLSGPTGPAFINFGGLSNPYWGVEVGEQYISTMLKALSAIDTPMVAIGSQAYKSAAGNASSTIPFQTIAPGQVEELLSASPVVIMTSGLGNIYEAALMGKPSLLLPPANDSQGQQMKLLQGQGMIDTGIDWHDLLPIDPIDYFADQPTVMQQLQQAITQLAGDDQAQQRLQVLIRASLDQLLRRSKTNLSGLIEQFGHNGVDSITEHILAFTPQSSSSHIFQAIRGSDQKLLQLHGYTIISDWQLELVQQGSVTGSLELMDQHGQPVTATYATQSLQPTSDISLLDQLKQAGFTHLAHTTRPENLDSILEMGGILPGNRLSNILYGDPIGQHHRILGQLVAYDGTESSIMQLLDITGYRAPVLLFPIDQVLTGDYYLNHGYPFGHYVTFSTSDGQFFPSLRHETTSDVQQLLADPVFMQHHEVVLEQPDLRLQFLEQIILYDDDQTSMSVCAKHHQKYQATTSIKPLEFLRDFPPYSGNSYAIVTHALSHRISDHDLIQLLLREIPTMATRPEAIKAMRARLALDGSSKTTATQRP